MTDTPLQHSADYVAPLRSDLNAMQVELARASSAVSRANLYAVHPYRSLIGALLDSIVAIEELVAGQTDDPGSDG